MRSDFLNFALLAWMAFGSVRLRFDYRAHGIVALRDFALLYYGLFFFLAQGWGADSAARRWLERCLDVAFITAPPVFLAFVRWPGFFTSNFTISGVPLIFVKSDVEGALLVAGVFWFVHRHLNAGHRWWLVAAAANLVAVAMSNSRAALLALAATACWPLLRRDWKIVRPLAGLAAAGLFMLVVVSALDPQPWTKSPAYRLYEMFATMVDVEGLNSYESDDIGDKPDNNRFRLTWWRIVVDQTVNESPWVGLGFGYDLAGEFTRIYYADTLEQFNARSPHNFVLTVFGRMGFAGLVFLAGLIAGLTRLLWQRGTVARREEGGDSSYALALGAWGILLSACFGVVLEGPMGATIFWTALGLANSKPKVESDRNLESEAAESSSPAKTSATPEEEPALPTSRSSA